MSVSNILNINNGVDYDENITRYDVHNYSPATSLSLDAADNIIISVNQESSYLLISESGIYIEGKITKGDGTGLPAGTEVTLVNNALCFLFSEIRLEMNNVEIDSCKEVGITSSLKAYASYSQNELKRFETTGWNKTIALGEGFTFSGYIPLKFILGFAENYEKIILNQRMDLILMRSKKPKDALKGAATLDTKIQLTKILWKVPHIQVSDPIRLQLLSQYRKNIPVTMSFRKWNLNYYPNIPAVKESSWTVRSTTAVERPRYIILGFQTSRDNDFTKDPSEFDHCDLKNLKVFLNSESYPYEALNLDMGGKKYVPLYLMYCAFQESYYGKLSEPFLAYNEFLSKAPIVVIDCSKSYELWKHSSSVDIRVEYELKNNAPNDTDLFALIIHDSVVRLQPLTNSIQKVM
uniref:Double jelly roll-like domain-containing protein n=1 Tax=Cacopsylla melanoneura TaxID=428564 RepID=A0A8D8RM82_9HEMI